MIPDEAVEAAAEALYENKYEYRAWDEAKSPDSWRDQARAALEAALPYLAEAARQPQLTSPTDWPDVPRLP